MNRLTAALTPTSEVSTLLAGAEASLIGSLHPAAARERYLNALFLVGMPKADKGQVLIASDTWAYLKTVHPGLVKE